MTLCNPAGHLEVTPYSAQAKSDAYFLTDNIFPQKIEMDLLSKLNWVSVILYGFCERHFQNQEFDEVWYFTRLALSQV